jgi:hypothetical protein
MSARRSSGAGAVTFPLILEGTSFSINKKLLLTNSQFVDLHGGAFTTGHYEVQSAVTPTLLQEFIKAIEEDKTIAITDENVESLTQLSGEFGVPSIASDCAEFKSSKQASPEAPDSISELLSLQERVSRQDLVIVDLQAQISRIASRFESQLEVLRDEVQTSQAPQLQQIAAEAVQVLRRDLDAITATTSSLTERLCVVEEKLIPVHTSPDQTHLKKFEVKLSDFPPIEILAEALVGKILKSRDPRTGKIVAVKTISRSLTQAARISFEREVSIQAAFRHPSLVPLRGYSPYSCVDGHYSGCSITDLMPKGHLGTMINRERDGSAPIEWNDTQKLIVLYGTAVALKLLHEHNVIHRNLNPKAVLLDDNLEPKLGGFAFAKYFDPDQPLKQSMHGGTPLFMAPEILRGEDFGIPGDVVAFGMLIYFVVTKLVQFNDRGLQFSDWDLAPETRRIALQSRISQMPSSANRAYGELMEQCCRENPIERPTFDSIVKRMGSNPSRFGQIDTVRFRHYQAKMHA